MGKPIIRIIIYLQIKSTNSDKKTIVRIWKKPAKNCFYSSVTVKNIPARVFPVLKKMNLRPDRYRQRRFTISHSNLQITSQAEPLPNTFLPYRHYSATICVRLCDYPTNLHSTVHVHPGSLSRHNLYFRSSPLHIPDFYPLHTKLLIPGTGITLNQGELV